MERLRGGDDTVLTPSYLEISMTFVVWTCCTFENIFGIKHQLEKYLKGSCELVSDLHFALLVFIG